MNEFIFHADCRHFRSERPCLFHKQKEVICAECPYYEPIEKRILILKLAADGDVLRTTCLLPSLKAQYPESRITWVTEKSAKPLLEKNPYIDRIWAPPEKYLPQLLTESFDLLINVDADPGTCALSALARAEEKRGFQSDQSGASQPLSDAARQWLLMGIRDDLKTANRVSYPELIYRIADLKPPVHRPVLNLTDKEIAEAGDYLRSCGWGNEERLIVGIHTGAGSRWPCKTLPYDTLENVILQLSEIKRPLDIFLLGGPEEKERNQSLDHRFKGRIIDTGTLNPIRRFASIIAHTDALICPDSLPMHIGLALIKYVIVHFGPTSPWEIDLYDLGEKVIPPVPCISCYRSDCDVSPSCNQQITAEMIIEPLMNYVGTKSTASP